MTALSRQTKQIFIVISPLVIGSLLYFLFRSQQPFFLSWTEPLKEPIATVGLVDWLPDYLWCFSLLAVVAIIWKGWKNIPVTWLLFIWVAVSLTEFFQYKHWIFGTGDWKDLIAYQFAFVTHFFINRKPLL